MLNQHAHRRQATICAAQRLTAVAIAWALIAGGASADGSDDLDRMLQVELKPLLAAHCQECHSAGEAQGDAILDTPASSDAMRSNRELWLRALRQVQAGAMPPPDAEELPDAEREKLAHLIDHICNDIDCDGPVNPGKVTLRRLNRNEYRNTIRDLLGVDYKPAADFPGDDVGYGFDNIGDVLSLPPLLLEKYLNAAEQIMGQAIITARPERIFEKRFYPGDFKGKAAESLHEGNIGLYSRGAVTLDCELPWSGQYTITVAAYGDQAGDEPVKLSLQIDDRKAMTIDVPATQMSEYSVTVSIGSGKRRLTLDLLNDYYVEKKGKTPAQDRNAYIGSLLMQSTLAAQTNADQSKLPDSHQRLIFTRPDANKSADVAAGEVLNRFASRAFRRPVTGWELGRFERIAAQVRRDGGTFEESIQVACEAILISPHFLFRYEFARQRADDGTYPRLSQFELATRLSYFLNCSMPDDELFAAAAQKRLNDPAVLQAQVKRLLKDPRIILMIDNFASQWLQLRNLDESNPDPKLFPGFNDNIRQLMRRETLTFFAAIVRYDRPVTMLLDGQFSYMNGPLAKFYGIEGIEGDDFQYVSLADTPRAGLLSHASILTVTSNPTRTSPVKRGKWILDNLLGTPPPPPPANVPELEKTELKGTLRERLEQHRADPACASCHKLMDPLGFALENFDAVGLWRQRDGDETIDASGELPGGLKIDGIDDLRTVLIAERREQFVRCLTEKLLTFALGRGLEYYDRCAIDKIIARVQAGNYLFSELVMGIVQSDPFQRQGER